LASYWREETADAGATEFSAFRSFVNLYYGKEKLTALFQNENNTDKDIIQRLDQWWNQYQKQEKQMKSTILKT
jgi:hypothetical protein